MSDAPEDVRIVGATSKVPASEVLRCIEKYEVLIGAREDGRRFSSQETEEWHFYRKCVQIRTSYSWSEDGTRLPAHAHEMQRKLVEQLKGSEWNLLPVDLRYMETKNAILRELLSIGLTPAAWWYVVDHLPTKETQLRGALLVIMSDKLKSAAWKASLPTKLSRIVELVGRLKLLMQLSELPQKSRDQLLKDVEELDTVQAMHPNVMHDKSLNGAVRKCQPQKELSLSLDTSGMTTEEEHAAVGSSVKSIPFSSPVLPVVPAVFASADNRTMPSTLAPLRTTSQEAVAEQPAAGVGKASTKRGRPPAKVATKSKAKVVEAGDETDVGPSTSLGLQPIAQPHYVEPTKPAVKKRGRPAKVKTPPPVNTPPPSGAPSVESSNAATDEREQAKKVVEGRGEERVKKSASQKVATTKVVPETTERRRSQRTKK